MITPWIWNWIILVYKANDPDKTLSIVDDELFPNLKRIFDNMEEADKIKDVWKKKGYEARVINIRVPDYVKINLMKDRIV